MKNYILLFLMLTSIGLVSLANFYRQNPVVITECQCYCSDLCGPRDAKDTDSPFIDPATGICFCQQRDLDNFVPNSCHLKQNETIPNSCCAIQ